MGNNGAIVVVNAGWRWYLPYVLHQARSASRGSRVVLLGDARASRATTHAARLKSLESRAAREFRKRYQHMSSNAPGFELFCWLRWFYLLEYMRVERVRSVLHLDSDVLLYSSMAEIKARDFSDGRAGGYLVPERCEGPLGAASAHVSYWTRDFLEEFCAFAVRSFTDPCYLRLYREKWDFHRDNGIPGGVCDMTTLFLFWQENQHRICNLAVDSDGETFDNNINGSANCREGEYAMEGRYKRVRFSGDCPFLFAAESGARVRVHALHFQGRAKRLIPKFYHGAPFWGRGYCRSLGSLAVARDRVRDRVRALYRRLA